MQNGGSDWYQVDFGGLVKLGNLTMDNSAFSTNYPAQYELYGSTDGINFDASPFATGQGTAITTATFTARTVEAVKIVQSGTLAHWFGIGELTTTSCSM